MTITSLSLTFVYNNTADMARARATAAPPPATPPVTAPASTGSTSCEHGHDTPRRSPLFRALVDALDSLVAPAPRPAPATAAAPASAVALPGTAASADSTTPVAEATSNPATPAPVDTPVGIDEAVMNFARALMQALRGAMHGEGEGHRHAHHHHDNGRRAWGDPAQRVAQLGAQLGAAVPSTAPAPAPVPLDPAPAPATGIVDAANAVSGSVLGAVASTPLAPAGSTASTTLHVSLTINGNSPWQPMLTRTQQALIDAFGTLQVARGKPKDENEDEKSLSAELSAFLQELADKMRLGDPDEADATQPGALLHVTA